MATKKKTVMDRQYAAATRQIKALNAAVHRLLPRLPIGPGPQQLRRAIRTLRQTLNTRLLQLERRLAG